MKQSISLLVLLSASSIWAEGVMNFVCTSPQADYDLVVAIDTDADSATLTNVSDGGYYAYERGELYADDNSFMITYEPPAIDWSAPQYVDVCYDYAAGYLFALVSQENVWTAHYLYYPIVEQNPNREGCPESRIPDCPMPIVMSCQLI